MKRLALCFLVISIYCTGYAKEFPGYYINKDGDSIRCMFKFSDWEITPDAVSVIANNLSSTFTPSDIRGFGIDGYDEYKSARISYHKSNYTLLNAPDKFNDSVTSTFSFLKILVKGKYTLLEMSESSRSYFFIQEEDGEITELVYRVKRINMDIEEDNAYRYQLFNLFSKERVAHEYSNEITKSSYTARSIKTLIKKLNTRVTGVIYTRKKEAVTFEFYIGAIDRRFPTAFDGMYTTGNRIDPVKSASGGANILYFIPSKFKRFAVGASAGYSGYSYSASKTDSIVDFVSLNNHRTTTYTEHHNFENKVIMLNLYAMGILNPHNKAKIYLKGGFNINLILGGSKSIDIAYTSVTKGVRNGNVPVEGSSEGVKQVPTYGMYFNLNGGPGVKAGNHKLEFLFYTPGVLEPVYKFKIKMMGLYYYYTLFK